MMDQTGDFVALFDTRDDAREAIRRLAAGDVPRHAIEVLSAEPLMLEETGEVSTTKSRIPLYAILGSLLGAATAITLTTFTSQSVGLVTGGMPIIAPWPFGIIVFELTALGAMLGTLCRMIYEARLGRAVPPGDYGRHVADGRIVVVVRDDYRDRAASLIDENAA
ncbi:MAG TPA: quinol:electron acceptor oxidoreductase subunit ActD [Blastocatellia bacterium]|jgi:hypothetical protein